MDSSVVKECEGAADVFCGSFPTPTSCETGHSNTTVADLIASVLFAETDFLLLRTVAVASVQNCACLMSSSHRYSAASFWDWCLLTLPPGHRHRLEVQVLVTSLWFSISLYEPCKADESYQNATPLLRPSKSIRTEHFALFLPLRNGRPAARVDVVERAGEHAAAGGHVTRERDEARPRAKRQPTTRRSRETSALRRSQSSLNAQYVASGEAGLGAPLFAVRAGVVPHGASDN